MSNDSDLSRFGDRLRKLVKPNITEKDEEDEDLGLVASIKPSLSLMYKAGLASGVITPQFHYSN